VRLALLAGALVACYLFVLYSADTRLQLLKAQLDRDDPGWRLADVETSREVIPEEENSARCVVRARALMPKMWGAREFDESFADLEPPVRLTPAQYTQLAVELAEFPEAVLEARRLADMPRGRYQIIYKHPAIGTLLPDVQGTRGVAALLRYDAWRLADDGRTDEALRSCRATLNCGRSIGDEPTLISMLVRTAVVAIAHSTTERVLAQGEPDPLELAALQRAMEEEDAFPELITAMRGERGMLHDTMESLEAGDVSPSELAGPGGGPDWNERFFGWSARDNLRDEHPLLLKMLTQEIENAKLPPHEQKAAEQAIDAEITALPPTAVATRMLAPAIGKCCLTHRRKLALVRSLIVALAAERYRRDHGAWPATLDDLAKQYLDNVPLDPFDGKPLRYAKRPDGVTIYSVGPDEHDDGGRIVDHGGNQPGTDLGIRLWDADKRRQEAGP